MHLVIDIGNTRTKVAVFQEQQLLSHAVFEQLSVVEVERLIGQWDFSRMILSASGVLEAKWEGWIANHFDQYVLLTSDTPLPIRIAYKTPDTLGRDRIAAVMGAFQRFPNTSCLIIDAGTCITVDLLDEEGVYQGGNISPGIDMRMKAMHAYTARLPLVEKGPIRQLIGQSTEEALRNGAQMGTMLELAAMVGNMKKQYPALQVLLTGGDAPWLTYIAEEPIADFPHLVLEGLNAILQYNCPS